MKIKIIKNSRGDSWIEENIGMTFLVLEKSFTFTNDGEKHYEIEVRKASEGKCRSIAYILEEDCEIVLETEPFSPIEKALGVACYPISKNNTQVCVPIWCDYLMIQTTKELEDRGIISATLNGMSMVKNNGFMFSLLNPDAGTFTLHLEFEKIASLYPVYQWWCEVCLKQNICYWEKGHIFCPHCKTKYKIAISELE